MQYVIVVIASRLDVSGFIIIEITVMMFGGRSFISIRLLKVIGLRFGSITRIVLSWNLLVVIIFVTGLR